MTEHKLLDFIYLPMSKPCRWVLQQQPYHFQVMHVSGIKMIADSLSHKLKPENVANTKLGYETTCELYLQKQHQRPSVARYFQGDIDFMN